MKEDFDAYHKFLNGEDADGLDADMQEFLEKMDSLQVPDGRRSKADIWDEIEDAIDEPADQNDQKKGRSLQFIPWLAIAATITLLLIFKPWQGDNVQPAFEIAEVAAKASETKPILLPDSSLITINALSKMSYTADEKRVVQLEGEAFFEVKKGDPFIVETELGQVEVLGTSFNVFSRSDQFHAACKTGRVRVQIPSQDFDEVLKPGEKVLLDGDTILFTQVLEEFVGSWQKGEFYFEKRPIREVLEEIGRQYDVSINYDSLELRTFTGYFIKEDIDLALTMVCEPLDLTYEFDGTGGVVIKSK